MSSSISIPKRTREITPDVFQQSVRHDRKENTNPKQISSIGISRGEKKTYPPLTTEDTQSRVIRRKLTKSVVNVIPETKISARDDARTEQLELLTKTSGLGALALCLAR